MLQWGIGSTASEWDDAVEEGELVMEIMNRGSDCTEWTKSGARLPCLGAQG